MYLSLEISNTRLNWQFIDCVHWLWIMTCSVTDIKYDSVHYLKHECVHFAARANAILLITRGGVIILHRWLIHVPEYIALILQLIIALKYYDPNLIRDITIVYGSTTLIDINPMSHAWSLITASRCASWESKENRNSLSNFHLTLSKCFFLFL